MRARNAAALVLASVTAVVVTGCQDAVPQVAPGLNPNTALTIVGLQPAPDVSLGVTQDTRSEWAISHSWIQNDTGRQISVPWTPTILRWEQGGWRALPCPEESNVVGQICDGIMTAPNVIPAGREDDVLDLFSWPPDPIEPGVYAIVVPVWLRGLDTAEEAPQLGVVQVVTIGR